MADLIPPDATADEGITNAERASSAEIALLAFGKDTGAIRGIVGDHEDPLLIVGDLLADLAHWCDRNKLNLQSAIQYATDHYQTETGSEGRQLV